jgi:iron(III) transport system substrate-binding protein
MPKSKSHVRVRASSRLFLIAMAFALVLAACGGPEDSGEAAGGGETEPAAEGGGGETAAEGGGGETAAEGGGDVPAEMQDAVAQAQELGLEFITSHDDLVACAEEEGAVTAASSHDEDYELIAPFEEQYPFLDVTLADFSGREARERFILEVEAGQFPPYDVVSVPGELYPEISEMVNYYDVLGMAEAGVLDVPIDMIDDVTRSVVASGSTAGIFSYNEDAFTDMEVPTTWEELIDEKFSTTSGFRMLGDTRLQNYAPMVSAWGEEGTIDYYTRFAEVNQPIWVTGFSTHLVQMAQGESDGYPFVNLHSANQQTNEYGAPLAWAFLEPIPIRLSEEHAVTEWAENPCAGLLFVEWTATPEGQTAWETGDQPYQSSIFSEYEGGLRDLIEDTGMETSIARWPEMREAAATIESVLEATGFPQPVAEG